MTTTTPPPPKGTKAEGRRLWRSVLDAYDLADHERVLLREAVRLVDILDDLAAAVDRDGLVLTSATGGTRVHPAAVEARQCRIALARVLAALRLPEGDDAEAKRPQRRAGVRSPYRVHHLRLNGAG